MYRSRGRSALDESGAEIASQEPHGLGSYESSVTTISAGPAAAGFKVLYDSRNHLAVMAGMVTTATAENVLTSFTRAGRAEGRKPVIYAVEGFVHLQPDTWAIGSTMRIGWRLGVFEQEAQTGLASVDGAYSMWADQAASGTPFNTVAMFANTGRWVREGRIIREFATTNNMTDFYIVPRWRSRRGVALRENEMFGLYIEVGASGVATRTQSWLRTLVSDEG